jgi:hypothetical protein
MIDRSTFLAKYVVPGFPPNTRLCALAYLVIFIDIKTKNLFQTVPGALNAANHLHQPPLKIPFSSPISPLHFPTKCRPVHEVTVPLPATRPLASTHSPLSPPTHQTPPPPSVPRRRLRDTGRLIPLRPQHQEENKKWRWGQCTIILLNSSLLVRVGVGSMSPLEG